MNKDVIAQLLPEVFQRALLEGSPLDAILRVMEALHKPMEAVLDRQHEMLNAYQAPDDFLFLLACFVDMDRFLPQSELLDDNAQLSVPPSSGMGRLRELINAAPDLSKLRGTRRGLLLFLETATGLDNFRLIDSHESGAPSVQPFHLTVVAPAEARKHSSLIKQILEQEKPAFITYNLIYDV